MSAGLVSSLLGVGAALAVLVLALLLARRAPRVAVLLALATVCFVPVWLGANLGFNGNLFVPATVLACLAVAVVLLPIRGFRLSPVDGLLAFLLALAASSLLTSEPTLAMSFLITPFTYFVAGYALGRIATARVGADFIYRAIGILFTVVAVLVIIEFLTGFNPFIGLRTDGVLFTEWGDIQLRGGYARAEGAFGHSIALGASLALAVPLTLASGFRFPLRLGMTITMLAATVVTFSRIGIICAFLGVVLAALLLREHLSTAHRAVLLVGGAVIALTMLPLVTAVFSDAGEEAEASAAYRGDLFPLISQANLVGFSDVVSRSTDGSLRFGGFRSIDSQLVLTGMTTGLLALVAVAIAAIVAVVLCLRRRAEPGTIAIVAQLPALATVALITQYSVMLWLVIGVAATTQLAARARVASLPYLTAPLLTPTPGD